MIHIDEGMEGARRASGDAALAIVVDALRASATLTALIAAGVEEILVCGPVDTACSLAREYGDAILIGERNARKPEGFHLGNSPREIAAADLRGRRVIFTSTNGSRILVACRGAKQVVAGCVPNASVVEAAARVHMAAGGGVVIIAAGDEERSSDEDMASAVLLAEIIGPDIDPMQEELITRWRSLIAGEGLESIFLNSRHGAELCNLGLEEDVRFCAGPDNFSALAEVSEYFDHNGQAVARMRSAPG